MKKIFCILDSLLVLVAFASILGFAFSGHNSLSVLATILIFVISGLNLLYVLNYRNKKGIISVALIVLSIILSFVGNIFIVKNAILFFAILGLSQISLIVALVFNAKFSKWDIFYMSATALPMLLMVNLSPLFGFSSALNQIVVSLVIVSTMCILGLSIAHLIRKQSAFNITFSIVAFFNFVYVFGLIILKQSNVTHTIKPIIDIVFYIILLLFSATTVFVDKATKKVENKTKTNVVYVVSILLTTILVCYTIVSNFMAFNFVSGKIYKKKFMEMVNNDLNTPIVEIYTQNNAEPQNKTDYVNCSFEISNCANDEYNFSVPMAENYEDEGCVGIRLRGNSTMKARKRPYRIKFDEKQSFFGLKANKSWVLLADYYDQSYIRNYTAFTLANKFDNLDFSPTPHHVALIINNEFKGLYLLCEQMDEKKGRANVDEDFDVALDKDFPFFIEMDLNAYKEGVTGIDNFYVESVDNYVEIKFPEADERNATETRDVVYDYIYEYVNAVFTTIKTQEKVEVSFRDTPVGLEDLVDIDSVVDYYLVNEIMQTTDNPYKSIYFHKTKDGKMEFGPVWDFDFSMTTKLVAPYDKSYIEDSETLWIAQKSAIYQNLFKNESFYNKVVARYNEQSDAIIETYKEMKAYKAMIDEVAIIDAVMWHGTTGEFQFDMQYDYVRLFLMDRYNFLNYAFAQSHSDFLMLIK